MFKQNILANKITFFAAINCTEPPFPVRNNDMGMFNWTGVDGEDPRPYATAIRYYCPREGWGYPSNGANETTIYCQKDGTWSNDENIESCISTLTKLNLKKNKKMNSRASMFQSAS